MMKITKKEMLRFLQDVNFWFLSICAALGNLMLFEGTFGEQRRLIEFLIFAATLVINLNLLEKGQREEPS